MYRAWSLLFMLLTFWLGTAAANGVSIMFMGRNLTNGTGVICVSDIGEGSADLTEAGDALVCVTEYKNCCRVDDGAPGNGVGQWYVHGVRVPGGSSGAGINANIVRNRGTGLVRLDVKANHTTMVVGDYCCEIPDSMGVTIRLCVRGETGMCYSTMQPTTANLSTEAVVGVVIGVVLAIILLSIPIIMLCFVLFKRKKMTYHLGVEQRLNDKLNEESTRVTQSQEAADANYFEVENPVFFEHDNAPKGLANCTYTNTEALQNESANYELAGFDQELDNAFPNEKSPEAKKLSLTARSFFSSGSNISPTEQLTEAELAIMQYAVPKKRPPIG